MPKLKNNLADIFGQEKIRPEFEKEKPKRIKIFFVALAVFLITIVVVIYLGIRQFGG
jgi:hypothetical protein